MMHDRHIQGARVDAPRAGKSEVGIKALLEWAFQRELASLDFDEIGNAAGYVVGVDPIYQLMQQAALGCRVQGGGRSEPHHDAEIVASTVAALPDYCGGRRMALLIAELARAGQVPDWMPDAQPRYYPAETHTNRHGTKAKTEDAAKLGGTGWAAQPRRNRKGVVVYDTVKYCPCVVRPTAVAVACSRRAYLAWYGALLDLRAALQISHLTSFVVTDEMPPRTPWKKTA
ncbi:hypothetical protein [Ruegeria sp. Ofav3-42]|uniref:hypothetical protein n=1 Tax=Ruegeria sp. Ofav3-42 TaxID=2917759 RepID=UPI001EF5FC1B|nr:hypothetical protein [Ruegeria sp. Ofav3-42]MCG7520858.1 hypothetical protein [Ruegeria sp. Ofav3-42]